MGLLILRSSASESLQALRFPLNVSGSDTSAPYAVIKFANPQNDGFPVWGPANAGFTIIQRVRPRQQTGYYTTGGWWCQDNGTITFDDTHPYWGCHPYPTTQNNTGTSHVWEVAAQGQDKFDESESADPGTGTAVTKDVWVTQAIRVTHNGGTKTIQIYPDVSNMSDYAQYTTTSSYGDSLAAVNFAYIIGDSPWYNDGYQHERFGGDLAWRKMIAKSMSEADIVSEAASSSTLVTTDAQNNNWWSKKGFTSVDDLTDDYSSGRSFTRDDASNEITLVAQG